MFNQKLLDAYMRKHYPEEYMLKHALDDAFPELDTLKPVIDLAIKLCILVESNNMYILSNKTRKMIQSGNINKVVKQIADRIEYV